MFFGQVFFSVILTCIAYNSFGQSEDTDNTGYIAGIELHTAQELKTALLRAEQLMLNGQISLGSKMPVAFVLHGPEVRVLLRQNYLKYKKTVDLAASLSALGVVEIKACETWMDGNRVVVDDLQSFVDTVPYGPAEVSRLVDQESYLYF